MTHFEIYTFILCLIVFLLLAGLSIFCIALIFRLQSRLIRVGADDEKLVAEYEKTKLKKQSKFGKVCDYTLTIIMVAIFAIIFSGSLYINCTQNTYFDTFPTYRVVKTTSMAKKNEKNTYLSNNNLNNQIQAFDLILTYKVPKEEDLKVYDIVVYEVDDMLIVHRIVKIEEPNDNHPNERWFLLQGDAVEAPDRFPVRYEQIQGIYRGEKIPFIGSFVLFMQSPAGWLCMLLVVISVIATPILENKIAKTKQNRLDIIFVSKLELVTTSDEQAEVDWKARLSGTTKDNRTFVEKLEDTDVAKDYYHIIENKINEIKNFRVIDSKTRTFKSGNVSVAKFAVRGKTLNAYLGLNPAEFVGTKYKFIDVSNVKKYTNYPMRVKVTSDRQTRWTIELLDKLYEQNGLERLPKNVDWKERLKGIKNKNRSFKQRMRGNQKVQNYYSIIEEKIKELKEYRIIEGATRTFKSKSVPIVKFAVRGKTLNAYLALNPAEFVGTKYKFIDASNVKKFANYPMRVKLTSDRQVKWTIELLNKLIALNNLDRGEKNV